MVSISAMSIRACIARANRYRRGIRLRYWNELCTRLMAFVTTASREAVGTKAIFIAVFFHILLKKSTS